MRLLAVVLCAAASVAAFGAEVAGVKIEERDRVGNADLVLNGAGLRKRAFFQVYAAGLYLAERKTTATDVIAATGPKRVLMHMLRDVGADQFSDALVDGLRGNHSEAEIKAFEPRIKLLLAAMNGIGEAKSGMRITLDWLPAAGLQVTVNGKPAGAPIPGEDFYRAVLKNWIGEQPVQSDLKAALLGAKQ
ncbi:MAG: chalcone isomerase family protein [Betaproteobacteria bacterium]